MRKIQKVSIEKGIELLCGSIAPVSTERRLLKNCQGRILAEDITARVDVPSFDRSPYDGYALRGEDTSSADREHPVTLRILEEIPAGQCPRFTVVPGTASKILTGAPVPEGANAVVKYEITEYTDTEVRIFAPAAPHTDICPAGEDVRCGQLLGQKGQVVDPALASVLAGQGLEEVTVYRRPVCAVMSTGSELIPAGQPPAPGKIYDSNAVSLSAWLERLGADCEILPTTEDHPEQIAEKLRQALKENDFLVTSGGASVGDYDFAGSALELLGAEVLFRGLDVKPGGSAAAGAKDGKLIICLSGNPAAAVLTLLRVVAPAVRLLCGRSDIENTFFSLPLTEDFPKKSPRRRLIRGRLCIENGKAGFLPKAGQGNGVASSFLGCDLIGEIPAKSPPLKAGEFVRAFQI